MFKTTLVVTCVCLGLGYYFLFFKNDETALYYYTISKQQMRDDKKEQSLKSLKSGVRRAKKDTRGLLLLSLGNYYYRELDFVKAHETYLSLLKEYPVYRSTLRERLPRCLVEMGRIAEAQKMLMEFKQEYGDQFGEESAELLATTQVNATPDPNKPSSAQIRFVPHHSQKRGGPFQVFINWTQAQGQTDVFGYKPLPMKFSGDVWILDLDLPANKELPYQFFIKDKQDRIIAYSQWMRPTQEFQIITAQADDVSKRLLLPAAKKNKIYSRQSTHDGKRKIMVYWIDAGAWWTVRPMLELHALPNIEELFKSGSRSVMMSKPAWTGIVMRKLAQFDAYEPSWWKTVLVQLKGISLLDKFLPKVEADKSSVESYYRNRGVRYVNMTFNDAEGMEHLPTPSDFNAALTINQHLHENSFLNWVIHTQLEDTDRKTARMAELWHSDPAIDILLFRVPGLDIMSHAFFTYEAKDKEALKYLRNFYAYLDEKIGQARALLDQDDIFILMSDHGIISKTSHSPLAMFLAEGEPFTPGQELPSFSIDRMPWLIRYLAENKPTPEAVKTWLQPAP